MDNWGGKAHPGFLAVDIGNTHIKIAIVEGQWQIRRLPTDPSLSVQEVVSFFRQEFLHCISDSRRLTGAAIASVVPALTPTLAAAIHEFAGINPLVVTPSLKTGLQLAIEHPQRLGADRLANAVGAHHLFGSPLIVIDLGTATKFDVVTGDDRFIGGAIAPGLALGRDALANRTALLQPVPLVTAPPILARNTNQAIQSGLFWGHVSMMESMVMHLKDALQERQPVRVIATGGLSALFRGYPTVIDEFVPTLTVQGIRHLYWLNFS